MRWVVLIVVGLFCNSLFAVYEKWEKREDLNEFEKRARQNMKDYEAGIEEKVRRDALVELRSFSDENLKAIREELLNDVKMVVITALKSDNKWRVRVEAPPTLVRLNAKNALDALLEVAKNDKKKDVRAACVDAIAKLADKGDEKVIGVLGEILSNDGWSIVRSAAVDAIASLGGKGEIERLRKAVVEDKYSIVRSKALEALVALGDTSKEALEVAKGGLGDKYSSVRAAACELIAACGQKEEIPKEVEAKVIELLADKKPVVQGAAAKAVRAFVTEDVLETIAKMVKDKPDSISEDMLCEFIWMHAKVGTPKALDLIASHYLTSQDPDIKAEAVCALASKNDPRGIKEINEMLSGKLESYRKIQLLRLIVRNGVNAEEVIKSIEALRENTEVDTVRNEAKKALEALKGK